MQRHHGARALIEAARASDGEPPDAADQQHHDGATTMMPPATVPIFSHRARRSRFLRVLMLPSSQRLSAAVDRRLDAAGDGDGPFIDVDFVRLCRVLVADA